MRLAQLCKLCNDFNCASFNYDGGDCIETTTTEEPYYFPRYYNFYEYDGRLAFVHRRSQRLSAPSILCHPHTQKHICVDVQMYISIYVSMYLVPVAATMWIRVRSRLRTQRHRLRHQTRQRVLQRSVSQPPRQQSLPLPWMRTTTVKMLTGSCTVVLALSALHHRTGC